MVSVSTGKKGEQRMERWFKEFLKGIRAEF